MKDLLRKETEKVERLSSDSDAMRKRSEVLPQLSWKNMNNMLYFKEAEQKSFRSENKIEILKVTRISL